MATGTPMVNGEVSRHPAGGVHPSPGEGTLEGTLHQMNILIQENRDLKEALRMTNLSMKERFEDLSTWKDKQREERDFLEGKLDEARRRIEALTIDDQEPRSRRGEQEGGAEGRGQGGSANQSAELVALRAQVARLQAEKSDLVAMNSELQLKTGQDSPEDSFIEIRIASDGEMGAKDVCDGLASRFDMSASRLESEDLTVSQLLQSLRKETQRVERLQIELQAARARITELVEKESSESCTQTSLQLEEKRGIPPTAAGAATETEQKTQQENSGAGKAESEVEHLQSQMMTLFKELQQAQSKLDEAEGMKKNLQDRCRDMEQDVVTLKAQLVEKQLVQSENDRLKLQVESNKQQIQLEQRKAGEERNNLVQLKDAYTKLFEDYNELKEDRKKGTASKELADDLQVRLVAAEQALATKQQKIDVMKQEIFQKEKELETISVFQAQAEVYSSDFYAERAAREKIHEERERLATQLEFVKKQNTQLQDEMDSLGRMSLSEMQMRHVPRGSNPHGGAGSQGARGGDGRDRPQQGTLPEHACPKCFEICPDLDSLQIHIMDCII
ncbi:optineurin [Osmerus mordax]|uniref:optineurin n=1 Tax=Osmerus mordax TaxID=8014 RepID=UPI00350F7001